MFVSDNWYNFIVFQSHLFIHKVNMVPSLIILFAIVESVGTQQIDWTFGIVSNILLYCHCILLRNTQCQYLLLHFRVHSPLLLYTVPPHSIWKVLHASEQVALIVTCVHYCMRNAFMLWFWSGSGVYIEYFTFVEKYVWCVDCITHIIMYIIFYIGLAP